MGCYIGSYLAQQFTKIKRATSRDIFLGGLITTIAIAFSYDLTSLTKCSRSTHLDIEACIAMKMIVQEGDVYNFLFQDNHLPYPLSDPENTIIRMYDNNQLPVQDKLKPLHAKQSGIPSFHHPTSSSSTQTVDLSHIYTALFDISA